MSKEERTSLQSELAAALAAGKSCAEWASAHGVSERTAQRWATDPEVRAEVETYRRGNLDHAVRRILAEATTVQTTDTTFANQAHLPREFVAQIVGLYENTRLGRQEIYPEFLETTTSRFSARGSSTGGLATWFWTGSRRSTCCWRAATS